MKTVLFLIALALFVGAYIYFTVAERKALKDAVEETGKLLDYYDKQMNKLIDTVADLKDEIKGLKEN